MKIEIEVYNLGQELFMMKDNKVTTFYPQGLKIKSTYKGYSVSKWGESVHTRTGQGGYPFTVYYSKEQYPKDDGDWVLHNKLFSSKEDLLKSL
jgi:hypothetical protein